MQTAQIAGNTVIYLKIKYEIDNDMTRKFDTFIIGDTHRKS